MHSVINHSTQVTTHQSHSYSSVTEPSEAVNNYFSNVKELSVHTHTHTYQAHVSLEFHEGVNHQ